MKGTLLGGALDPVLTREGMSSRKSLEEKIMTKASNFWTSSKSFPLMEPFETTDLSTMIPSDLTGDGIKGLSQARYERDLYAIFSGKAFGDDDMQSMHQTWFQVSAALAMSFTIIHTHIMLIC